ncbi:MAG: histidine phosphatase family protein [Pyrinomonadaceae bacterium]|nr:histidine phosphatase family protein [Pyrinomonadaceae bacterium]
MKTARYVFIALIALSLVACSRPQAGPTVVLIVRHADKASDAEDSPLNEAGMQRAQALVGVAAGAGVNAIYTSQFKRNHDTAQPLAQRLGITPTEMAVNLQNPGDYGSRLAKDILEKHPGQTVLVVGHGNTIASTVEALTGKPAQLGDIQYSDLFIVTVPPSGPAKLIKAQYGMGSAGGNMMMK